MAREPVQTDIEGPGDGKIVLDTIITDMTAIQRRVEHHAGRSKGASKFLMSAISQEISRTLRKLRLMHEE